MRGSGTAEFDRQVSSHNKDTASTTKHLPHEGARLFVVLSFFRLHRTMRVYQLLRGGVPLVQTEDSVESKLALVGNAIENRTLPMPPKLPAQTTRGPSDSDSLSRSASPMPPTPTVHSTKPSRLCPTPTSRRHCLGPSTTMLDGTTPHEYHASTSTRVRQRFQPSGQRVETAQL